MEKGRIGKLFVKIFSARNLQSGTKISLWFPSFSLADACVVIKYDLVVSKSSVCRRGEDEDVVVWDEEFVLYVCRMALFHLLSYY
jgi:hypothetical protein